MKTDIEHFKHSECGGVIPIDLEKLKYRFDVVRIMCDTCGKQFMLGVETQDEEGTATFFMYQVFDGPETARILSALLVQENVPFLLATELVSNIKINKIEPFKRLLKRYLAKNPNEKIKNFVTENLIFD